MDVSGHGPGGDTTNRDECNYRSQLTGSMGSSVNIPAGKVDVVPPLHVWTVRSLLVVAASITCYHHYPYSTNSLKLSLHSAGPQSGNQMRGRRRILANIGR